MKMVRMTKGPNVKEVPENRVDHNCANGWKVDEEVRAVLHAPKKNTEDTPAVEDASSEQGDNDEANLKENEDE